jgi:hypothetical protein
VETIENLITEFTARIRALAVAEVQKNIVAFAGGLANFDGGKPRKPGLTANLKKPAKKLQPQTPILIAARKLQGRYLGSLKKLDGKKREQVKAEVKKTGVVGAVKLADKLLSGK